VVMTSLIWFLSATQHLMKWVHIMKSSVMKNSHRTKQKVNEKVPYIKIHLIS
jgi:hypothetical protein